MFINFWKIQSFVVVLCAVINIPVKVDAAKGCLLPGQPQHEQKENRYSVGAIVNYECGQGDELVLKEHRVCQENGSWSGMEPICAKNVALDAGTKVTDSLSGIVLPRIINDGFYNTCSTLQTSSDKSRDYSWKIVLPQAVKLVAIKTAITFQPGSTTEVSILFKDSSSMKDFLRFDSVSRPTTIQTVNVHGKNLWEYTSVVDRQMTITTAEINIQLKKLDNSDFDQSLCEVAIYSSSGEPYISTKRTSKQSGAADAMQSTASTSNLLSSFQYLLYCFLLWKVNGLNM